MAGLVMAVSAQLFLLPAGATHTAGAVAVVQCTTPPPAQDASFTPRALRRRYRIQPLLKAGYDGRGQTAVLIEFDQSVDIGAVEQWKACMHVKGPAITQKAMPGEDIPLPASPCDGASQPACFDEAQGDVYSMISGAPGLDRLYVIVSTKVEQVVLAHIVDQLRRGRLTDGRRPDVVSLSFGECQSGWGRRQVRRTEASLRALAKAGTWFFKAAGDAGPSDCSPHPQCDPSLKGPEMGYPAASPWVTSVGGTTVPSARPAGRPVVWNVHKLDPDVCTAGGGGLSIFHTPRYQRAVPFARAPRKRGLPDIAALAGSPGYLTLNSSGTWFGNGGTSLASPLYAAAFASIRSKLRAKRLAPPVELNTALYSIATKPIRYRRTFVDVVKGSNDIYGVGCCKARKGFDLASGLGELRIDKLANALAAYAAAQQSQGAYRPPERRTPSSTRPRSSQP